MLVIVLSLSGCAVNAAKITDDVFTRRNLDIKYLTKGRILDKSKQWVVRSLPSGSILHEQNSKLSALLVCKGSIPRPSSPGVPENHNQTISFTLKEVIMQDKIEVSFEKLTINYQSVNTTQQSQIPYDPEIENRAEYDAVVASFSAIADDLGNFLNNGRSN
jgi:hypothetical protein